MVVSIVHVMGTLLGYMQYHKEGTRPEKMFRDSH
jgi:hypothetical protein